MPDTTVDTDFEAIVWEYAWLNGMSAPKTTDAILKDYNKRAQIILKDIGWFNMFRNGMCDAVRAIIKAGMEDDDEGAGGKQYSFDDIDEQFRKDAKKLRKRYFFVPSLKAFIDLADLLKDFNLFIEAEQYMFEQATWTRQRATILQRIRKKAWPGRRSAEPSVGGTDIPDRSDP